MSTRQASMARLETAQAVSTALRNHLPLEDDVFDSLLPEPLGDRSSLYWTPLSVIEMASQWLTEAGARTVLDVGSGPGKFVVATALLSDLFVTGVEHRAALHAAAQGLVEILGAGDRVRLVHAPIDEVDMTQFDALYLFNPFGENLFAEEEQLDKTVALSEARYHEDVARMESTLERAPTGTLFLTYHGFGGRIPGSYFPMKSDFAGSDVLRLWRKSSDDASADSWCEVEGRINLAQTGPRKRASGVGRRKP